MMDKQIKSSLIFRGYRVKEINFKTNDELYELKPVKIDFDIDDTITVNKQNSTMIVELNLNVFKDMKQNNYPFSMNVKLEGLFFTEVGDIESYRTNAIAILYPYLRAIVSTYTANSNISTLILPPINVVNYIQNKKKKENKQ